MKEILISSIKQALSELQIESFDSELDTIKIILERPADMVNGDYSTNVAMAFAKKVGISPVSLAVQIVEKINSQKISALDKVEVAGPGFINFYISRTAIVNQINNILSSGDDYGKNILSKGLKVAIEYTDPNPFKQFHIGHLMQNAIGESLSRIVEWTGADTKRFCYQGDVGRHVALTIWGLRFLDEPIPEDSASLSVKTAFLGKAYALGSLKSKEILDAEDQIRELNKKIYEKSDEEVNEIYIKGREWSLEHFEEIYKVLGTKFDRYFFESSAAPVGMKTVLSHEDFFHKSEGAIIFKGEDYGLHTRVFVNKDGIPTYEGKELGLAELKFDAFPFDRSITVTANEQDDYFKVVLQAIRLVFPDIGNKMEHVSHGMLRLPSGKMSSRTGDVITGESLLADMIEMALEKMKDRPLSDEEKIKVSQEVAVAAIKYTILKQSLGRDIIFDQNKSLSFEGDSGPYLQYSCVRAKSVLKKGLDSGLEIDMKASGEGDQNIWNIKENGGKLERTLVRFPEVVERAFNENEPHYIANFLLECAALFNSFYAENQIVKEGDESSKYKLAITKAFSSVLQNGLWLLGISVPEKM